MAPQKKSTPARLGRFAYEGLDRAIHEKARLGILTSLAANRDGLPFNELKEFCSLTDGNLSRHLAVLEEAKLVTTRREGGVGRPQTIVAMTPAGRRKFQEYLQVLEQILADAANRQSAATPAVQKRSGFSPA